MPCRHLSNERALYWSLRLAVAVCLIGQGAFGLLGKGDWLPYLAVVGIPDWLGWRLGLWTALLRQVAGQGIKVSGDSSNALATTGYR